jgi:hypothetical protein
MDKVKAFWASLPHPVQALIVAAVTAAGTTFLHAVSEGNCYTVVCLKHYAATSLLAAVAVVRAFYMVPNRPALQGSNPVQS